MTFRYWVHELWLQNCDEHDEFRGSHYSQVEYFNMYKYWLKREYRHQMRTQNVR